jgi:hypothetical protein
MPTLEIIEECTARSIPMKPMGARCIDIQPQANMPASMTEGFVVEDPDAPA